MQDTNKFQLPIINNQTKNKEKIAKLLKTNHACPSLAETTKHEVGFAFLLLTFYLT